MLDPAPSYRDKDSREHQPQVHAAGLLLLALSAWIRRQAWLAAIYRRFPVDWRMFVSRTMAARSTRDLRFKRTRAWSTAGSTATGPLQGAILNGVDPKFAVAAGVNLHGYFRGQFGLAESARVYARAWMAAGYPLALCDLDIELPHSLGDASLGAAISSSCPHPVDIIFVNPDQLGLALEKIESEHPGKRYRVGCWFWELENFPKQWIPALDQVDAVMVASEFIAQSIRRVTDKPVFVIPLPVNDLTDSGLTRADFGLSQDDFIFLCSFDFNSWMSRKNPIAVVEAFKRAFPADRTGVRLLLKSSNGHRHPESLAALIGAVGGDHRVLMRDEVLEREHVYALQRCCNAFVSLHRSEGFGLGLAECMLQGRSAIATGYSGNLQFMSAENSLLVNYRLVPVQPGEYLYIDGQLWAEPNLDHAASLMRELADQPGRAAALGFTAQCDLRSRFSPFVCAEALASSLAEAGCASRASTQ